MSSIGYPRSVWKSGSSWLAAAACAVCISLVTPARAEPSAEDKALSSELFKQAKKLLAEGKTAEACAKLEESQRLLPATGTLLNLAICHETLGKTATAYAELGEARARALKDGQKDRVKLADQHIAALEPKLSRLTISVPAEVDVPSLRVFRDGSEVGRAAWGTAMPVDPGEHQIEARAEGKKTWTRSVQVGADADAKSIQLEALESDEPPAAEPPPPAPPPPAPVLPPPQPVAPKAEHDRGSVPPRGAGDDQRTLAYVLGGVGVVGVGVGSYFGLRAYSKWSDSDAGCPKDDRCTAAGAQAAKDARTAADVSTVSFAIGGAALGAGAFLFFTAEPSQPETAKLWFRPAVGPSTAHAAFGGRF